MFSCFHKTRHEIKFAIFCYNYKIRFRKQIFQNVGIPESFETVNVMAVKKLLWHL